MTQKLVLTAALMILFAGLAVEVSADDRASGRDGLEKLAQFNRGPAGTSERERQEFCRVYASTALEQQRRNIQERCNYSGPRWSDNSGDHFSWCMIYPHEAEQEARERDNLLKRCDTAGGDQKDRGKRAACDHYARIAVEEAQSNEKQKCGYTGPQWGNDRDAHYAWCMAQRPGVPDEEINGRERDLALCFAQADDFADYEDDCDGFARRSVQQNDRNAFLRCGFRGTEWTSDYAIHRDFCIRSNREERLNLLRSRARQLQGCRPS